MLKESKEKFYNTVALIPARGGSKGIPLKNIKEMNGKPLIFWVLEETIKCKIIDKVFIATDSKKISDALLCYSENDKVEIIGRSAKSAIDTAASELVLIEFSNNYNFNNVFMVQATAPLLSSKDLEGAFKLYKKYKYDTVLSVVERHLFFWEQKGKKAVPLNYEPKQRPRRQDFEPSLIENGAFYLTKRDLILKNKCRISGKVGLYKMPDYTFYDIDSHCDWIINERLLQEYKERVDNELKKYEIKLFVTDIDGVMTDSGMYYSERGDELKKFNTRDGKAIELLRKAGVKTAIITSENTIIVTNRAKKLKVDFVFQGVADKKKIIFDLCSELNIDLKTIAYVGDDLNDLEAMKIVGLPICPANAVDSIKKISKYICKNKGGNGVLREVVENLILL